ncbi:MAG: glycosyltransferase [Flavobacterium sp.]|uniref:glycosyltransferase n=1 Tax=Flavobacterium sp. TaxID=239 RepID=UPI003BA62510
MKKILYILDTFETGGAEKSLLDIAMHNHEVVSVFVTLYQGNQLAETAQKAGIKVIALNRKEKYAFGKIAQLLLPIVREEQPDIIHATLFRADIVARKLKKYFSIPLVSSLVNNSYVAERYQKLSFIGKLKLNYIQQLDAKTAKKVDFFVSNSQTIKDSNAKALRLDLDKIKVIYRGRELSKFTSITSQQIEETKNILGISSTTFVLLNVSRLLDRKGQLDLLKAINEVRKTNLSLKLLIAGEGFYRSVLEQYIQENDLSAHVTLLGNREDVPVLLQLADAFVFPSHYEGLPGALIEAMMAKKTIICSDIPENKECVSDKEALIFQKGNVAQLVQMIESVIHHPNAYNDLGENAKKVAIEKFSIEKVVAQYNSFYSSIVNTSQP